MGEYIYNVQEKIEIENGQVLKEREKCISNFIGLGPPDICILTKSYEPPRFVPGLKTHKVSSFHWTSGVNTESISAAAVYLGSLLDNQEKSSFGRGIYKIDLCHLISYNAFLKMDLHIELPGTSNHNSPPTTYSLNALGEKNQLEDTFWLETYISSVLRFIQGPTPYLRPVKILPNLLKNPDDESDFLKLCQQHFWQGRKLGSYDRDLYIDFNSTGSSSSNNTNSESMEIDDSNNLLVTTISKYFTSRNRYAPMLSFFEELYKTEPTVSVPVSIATRLLGNIDESISILERSLIKSPDSISILIELANAYLFKNNKDQSPSPLLNNLNSPIVTSTTSSNNSSPTTATTNTTTTPAQSVPLSNSSNDSIVQNSTPVVNEILIKALKYILKALSQKPGLIEAWEITAKILIAMGYHEWALIFLNNTPNVQLDHSVDRVGRGQYQKVTPAQENPNIISVLEDEEIEFDEEPGEETLKRLSSNSLSGDSKKYFKILVGLIKKIGWIQLVDKKNKIIDELAVALRDKHKKEVNNNSTTTNTTRGNTSGGSTTITSNSTLKKSTEDGGSSNEVGDKNTNGSGVNISKDGHNTTSPTIKTTQATENTLNNSTDNAATVTNNNTNTDNSESASTTNNQPPIDNEPNVPTQVLWRDEDVTSDGSDIGEDELDKIDLEQGEQGEDGSSSQTTTETTSNVTTTQEVKPKIIRKPFDENSLSSSIDNLSEVLSTFIDDFGSDSLNTPTSAADKKYLTFDLNSCFSKVRLPVSYSNRNLDLAFHALFQDIKAFQSWKEEEEQKKVSDTLQLSLKHINPHRSIADWTRIGKLAYRIGELGDSEKLFLKLLAEDKSHPHAILGLIKIFTDHGDIRNCLISSSQLSKYYSFKYKTLEIHPEVESSILNLISKFGLQKVRNIFGSLPDSNNNFNLISGLFLDSVKWSSFGYNK